MKISRSNYESWLIDYLDGKLDRDACLSVEKFLAANPDIADEFSEAGPERFLPDEGLKMDKTDLFHSLNEITDISDSSYEEFCIAYYEGDLDPSARRKVERMAEADPYKKYLLGLYSRIHFNPDIRIHYPAKTSLKKEQVFRLNRTFYIAMAGAAAILIGFLLLPYLTPAVSGPKIAPVQKQVSQLPQTDKQVVKSTAANDLTDMSIPSAKKESRRSAHKLLAVIDTNNQRPRETIVLAALKPIPSDFKDFLSDDHDVPEIPMNNSFITPVPSPYLKAEKQTRVITEETILWSALKVGILGFNSLTENELALDTRQNESGRVTGIKIYAENFQFERKIKKNILN